MSEITRKHIIGELDELKSEGESIRNGTRMGGWYGTTPIIEEGAFNAWRAKILTMIDSRGIKAPEIRTRIAEEDAKYPKNIDAIQALLESLTDSINKGFIALSSKNRTMSAERDSELINIFNKFHRIARQLRTRYANRGTLTISDEYDVQDLLHALLLLHFDDVRAEEWTPSYAGGAVRMDFLLKDCSTVIEVKKTRQTMTVKDLGEQLIIDREKYRSHPDCKKLYCFVYDPDGYLGNPVGIKRDLESGNEDFLKVFIEPD